MLKYFSGSYIVAILGFIAAYFWGEHFNQGTGWACVFIAFVLAVYRSGFNPTNN